MSCVKPHERLADFLSCSHGNSCTGRRNDQQPCAATGGHSQQPEASVALMPRSLLVFTDEAYSSCLHSIEKVRNQQMIQGLQLC